MSDFAIETRTTGGVDNRWLASAHGVTAVPGTLDISSVIGEVDQYGYIPGGVALGKITATGQYGIFDTTGLLTDGTELLAGFTREATNVKTSLNVTLPSGKASIAVVKTATVNRTYLPVVAQRTAIDHTTVSTGQFVYTD